MANLHTTDSTLLSLAVERASDLTRFLGFQIGNVPDAQDLMQELYIRIIRLKSQGEIRSPKAYLFRIAANLAYEYRLQRQASPPLISLELWLAESEEEHMPPASPDNPETRAVTAQEVATLVRSLGELSPKIQAAVLLHHHDGYTCEEISLKLKVVPHRVKKYLVKGIARCRAAMNEAVAEHAAEVG